MIQLVWRSIHQVGFDSILFNFSYHPSVVGNVYIADHWNFCIRLVTVSTGIISTIAGTGSSGTSATCPYGVALDSSG